MESILSKSLKEAMIYIGQPEIKDSLSCALKHIAANADHKDSAKVSGAKCLPVALVLRCHAMDCDERSRESLDALASVSIRVVDALERVCAEMAEGNTASCCEFVEIFSEYMDKFEAWRAIDKAVLVSKVQDVLVMQTTGDVEVDLSLAELKTRLAQLRQSGAL